MGLLGPGMNRTKRRLRRLRSSGSSVAEAEMKAGMMQRVNTIRKGWKRAVMTVGGAIVFSLAAFTPSLMAQVSAYGDKATGPANDRPPTILDGVSIAQKLNGQLPLDLSFTDDQGQQVQL